MSSDLLQDFGLSFVRERWVTQIFVVVLGVVALNLAFDRLLARLQALAEKTENPWDDALFDSLRRPLAALLWIVGVAFCAQIAHEETHATIFVAAGPMRDIGVIACLTWFLQRFIASIATNMVAQGHARGEAVDKTSVDAISKLLRVTVLITAVLVGLQTLGFSISGVLAFGGIGGIAVGFAAKDLLANFFGGLTIYLDRPFVVGEWIRSPDKDIEGTVEHIGWRLTRIRTFSKRPIYVPNSLFTNIVVENPSRMTNRLIREVIGIRYDDLAKMSAIVADVRRMLEEHQEIDQSMTLIVSFDTFADSSLNFFIYTFTRTTDWVRFHAIKQDVLLRVADVIERHGAEIAFPTRTLHLVPAETASVAEKEARSGSGPVALNPHQR